MTPLVHSSLGSITLVPRVCLNQRKEIHLTKCEISSKCRKFKSSERILLPQSSFRLFHLYGNRYGSRIQTVEAVGADITVEESSSAASGEVSNENAEEPSSTVESTASTSTNPSPVPASKSRRPRPVRKSEMPPVKDDELIPGASFTGKVRSIQPFGCFVDFGAYTDGLVHVSRMSDGYVKDVASFVSIGQEVKVRIVEANRENGRISLTMRDNDDTTRVQQKRETPKGENSEKPRSARKSALKSNQKREDTQRSTNLVKGQLLDGVVKNLTRSGAFVSFPDGEEGFLPASEESEGFGGILGSSSLQVGQEVNVRVLRISRGKVTLTMKKEEDVEGLNMQLNKGVTHVASNPFELAFRKSKEIAAFLDQREQAQSSEKSEESVEKVDEPSAESDGLKADGSTASSNEEELKATEVESSETLTSSSSYSVVDEVSETDAISASDTLEDQNLNAEGELSSETLTSSSSYSVVDEVSVTDAISASDTLEDQNLNAEGELTKTDSSVTEVIDEANLTEVGEASAVIDEVKETDATVGAVLGDSVSSETPNVSEANAISASDLSEDQKLNITEVESIENYSSVTEVIDDTSLTDKVEGNSQTDEITEIDATVGAALGDDVSTETSNSGTSHSEDGAPDEIANGQDNTTVNEAVEEPPIAAEKETVSANLEDGKVEAAGSINAQTGPYDQESGVKATVSPALVKQLREETGAGMMDCKKALAETGGDIVKAQEFLRKKGLASADKKSSRATAEGRIGSYIHDNRIGILIEVNCETDFVSRGEIFKELVDDLAMQVAACPQVSYVATDDVPEDIVNKEKEIEMQKEDLLKKPENIRSKIVDGRINKRLEELSLLDQPYIKNDKLVVGDLVKQTIATIGENIKVKRFVRYNLGEGLEKKSQDFAAEVAAQTSAKSSSSVSTDKPADTNDTTEKPSTIVVSAALVKQLREETGAGMMDCKKALAETGGDLVKAQEYLRKKGLSSAEKKSSRLAAEGRIASYIHDSRIGTLIEVNCETDFVARNERFKELVDDLAMQVVACPQIEFVSIEEISEDVVKKEKDIEMQREDLKSKPEQIKEKIVEGRVTKRLGELALLEQPFIKDDNIKVKDRIKQTVATLGENIKVRRFTRFTLGENKD